MPPNFLNPVTVTIVRRTVTGQDGFGNDIYGQTTEDVLGSVQPGTSRERLDFTDQLVSGVVVFVPYGTDVEYIDAIIVNGVQYEVNASPDVWRSPFSGSTAPVRIEGTLVVGASS
jgi:hypothetical protein